MHIKFLFYFVNYIALLRQSFITQSISLGSCQLLLSLKWLLKRNNLGSKKRPRPSQIWKLMVQNSNTCWKGLSIKVILTLIKLFFFCFSEQKWCSTRFFQKIIMNSFLHFPFFILVFTSVFLSKSNALEVSSINPLG